MTKEEFDNARWDRRTRIRVNEVPVELVAINFKLREICIHYVNTTAWLPCELVGLDKEKGGEG